jgi:glycosyltransferase involved in cell wall biosynthesis
MNVGVYFPGFPPEAGGGYTFEQDVLSALINLSSQSHHQFTLIFQAHASNLPQLSSDNLQIVILEEPKLASRLSSFLGKVFQKISPRNNSVESAFQKSVRKENIEFVWFPTSNYSSVEIPYVATVWDIQHRLQPWFPEVSRDGLWDHREVYYSRYLKRAAYVITPNIAGRDELALFYQLPVERFRLLPHPVPIIEHLPDEDEVERVLEKYQLLRGFIFYPAQFWAHKNHVNLLLALHELKEIYGLAKHLVLVGSDQGNLENVQRWVQRLGLEEQVHILGFIPREDLIALYRGAFALTYVSLFGPENLPPLEAFKCDCPVIASLVSGAREQYGDAALLVDGLAPEEIARAVMRLEQEIGLRQTLIEKGHKRADAYTSKDYVCDVMKIFDDFEKIQRNWGIAK